MGCQVKIKEIIAGVDCFKATIKAKRGNSSTTVKTIVFADGISQARALLGAMYGDDNVVSVARISENQISEANIVPPERITNPRIFPNQHKEDIVQKLLLKQLKQNALQVKPTAHDLKAAQSDFEAEQKRVNREYENKLKWGEIRKGRLKNTTIFKSNEK
jgi:hypothetical protein